MTILEVSATLFSADHPGGGERHVTELVNELSRWENVVTSSVVRERELPTGRSTLQLTQSRVQLRHPGSETDPFPALDSPFKIRRWLKQESNLEIVHIHNPRTAASALWTICAHLRKRGLRTKILLTDHGARMFPAPKILASMADYYVPVSRFSEALMTRWVPKPSCVIPVGVSSALVPKGQVPGFSERTIDILCVGRMVPWKRLESVVQLAQRLTASSRRPIRTIFAGHPRDWDYVNKLRSLIRRNGLDRTVTLLYNPTDSELLRLYQSSRVHLLFSGQRDHSGRFHPAPELASIVSLEAAASGTPSVVTDLPGPMEQVIDGHTGYIVSQWKTAEAMSRVGSLLDDSQAWRTMSGLSREYVLRERTYEILTKRFLEFVRGIRDTRQ